MKLAAYLLVPAAFLGAAPAFAQDKPAPAAKPAPAPKPAPAAKPVAAAPAPAAPAPEAPAPAAPAAAAATAPAVTPAPAEDAAPASASAPTEPAPVEPVAAPPAPTPAAPPPAPTPTEPPPQPSSLELFGDVSATVVHGDPANPRLTNSFRRVGIYGEAGVAYRSKYFLDPFISVGYGSLASGETEIPDAYYNNADQPGGTLHQHLGIWTISPGVTSDIWRFRLRVGVGVAVVVESNRFHGDKNTATQIPLVAQLGVAYNFYEVPRFRLDGELRAVRAAGADVTFWALGVTARGDAITF